MGLVAIPMRTYNISTVRTATEARPTVLDYRQVAQRPMVYFPSNKRVVEDAMPTMDVFQHPKGGK